VVGVKWNMARNVRLNWKSPLSLYAWLCIQKSRRLMLNEINVNKSWKPLVISNKAF